MSITSGYSSAVDCGPVARIRRLRRNPGNAGGVARTGASSAASGKCAGPVTSVLFHPGGAALTGLRVHRRLRAGSPVKAFTSQSGECRRSSPDRRVKRRLREMCRPETFALFHPGGAALTGLRVHRRLRAGSPDKAFTPPSGECRQLLPVVGPRAVFTQIVFIQQGRRDRLFVSA